MKQSWQIYHFQQNGNSIHTQVLIWSRSLATSAMLVTVINPKIAVVTFHQARSYLSSDVALPSTKL